MTQPTLSQLQEAPPNREFEWVVEMPREIAEMFGVRAELPVMLHAQPGTICAHMDLTEQTAEARNRQPGWFIEMTPEAAAATGFAPGSVIAVYAKQGAPYVEVYPPLKPDLAAILERILEEDREFFEKMKRLGD